jgi:hypothetical protein
MTDEQTAYVEGLRGLADFLELRPELIPINYVSLWHFVAADQFGTLAQTMGGSTKTASDKYLGLDRKFGPHSLNLRVEREEVCERVVTGTEIVEIDDPDAPPVPKITVERDKVEWVCPPSFLALGES